MKKIIEVIVNNWQSSREITVAEGKVSLSIVVHCATCPICIQRIEYVKYHLDQKKGTFHTGKYGLSRVEVPFKKGEDPIELIKEALPGIRIKPIKITEFLDF